VNDSSPRGPGSAAPVAGIVAMVTVAVGEAVVRTVLPLAMVDAGIDSLLVIGVTVAVWQGAGVLAAAQRGTAAAAAFLLAWLSTSREWAVVYALVAICGLAVIGRARCSGVLRGIQHSQNRCPSRAPFPRPYACSAVPPWSPARSSAWPA
jgi:hypothetical protein